MGSSRCYHILNSRCQICWQHLDFLCSMRCLYWHHDDSCLGGRWKCCDVVLHAGFNLSIWMGVCGMVTLSASPGQMSVILAGAAAGEEVIIHTFGAYGCWCTNTVGISWLVGNIFSGYQSCLWCREMINMLVGWQVGNSGVFSIQNCPLAFFYMFGTGSPKSQLY